MLHDVIAAQATPPGRSAVALIRLSGEGAFAVAQRVVMGFTTSQPRRQRRARVHHPQSDEVLDDVLYAVFPAPASYTGEDLVELTCHGGLLAPVEVLGALYAAGARPALAGEFTRRAVLHGKLDLLQAEAIGDLVDATAPAQRRAALFQLDRGTSARIGTLRERVLELEALISYDIDFPEEDDGPVPPERITAALADARETVKALLETAATGTRLQHGALAVIAGPPNAGKSSLFNALLGENRAIVTEIAGTTRDAIEAPVVCDGFPFRLVDTAGLQASADRLERLGIEVSQRYLDAADVVVLCVEAGAPLTGAHSSFLDGLRVPSLLVRTKGDLVDGIEGEDASALVGEDASALVVSALTGAGLGELRNALARLAFGALVHQADPGPVLVRERHRAALARALDELDSFAADRARGVEGVVAAVHLRAAATTLESVVGLVTPDDVLDRVFSTFCIGK